MPSTVYLWDISKLIQKWKYNERDKGIIELSTDKEVTGQYVNFYSSNYTGSDHLIPTLIIGYVQQTGLNNYWTYHSQSAGRAGVGYVTDYTGSLVFIHNDYLPLGELFSFEISHVYNLDNRDINKGYGQGWDVSLNARLSYDYETDLMMHRDADGSVTYYYNIYEDINLGEYVYIAEDGSYQRAYQHIYDDVNNFGTEKHLLTPEHVEFVFNDFRDNQTGTRNIWLTVSDNVNTGYYTVHYIGNSEKIDFVEDSVGNKAEFHYYSTDGGNLKDIIIKRKDKNNYLVNYQKIEYSYFNNNLVSITHYSYDASTQTWVSNGDINIYDYDATDRLINAKNTYENGLEYHYISSTRDQVSMVRLYNIENGTRKYISLLEIEYLFKQTKFKDENGKSVMYTFDNYGHTINILDSFGNAQFYVYYDLFSHKPVNNYLVNWNLNHKIIFVSTPQKSNLTGNGNLIDNRVNLIENPSFESNTNGWILNGMTRDISSAQGTYKNILGNYAIKVNGDGDTVKSIKKEITVQGYAGQSFIFGGWAQGYVQPANYQSDKRFRIILVIYEYYEQMLYDLVCTPDPYTGGIVCNYMPIGYEKIYTPKTYTLDFNTNVETWQYLMREVKTTRTYDKIDMIVEYLGEGTVYFDGLQLYQGSFGTSYSYVGQDNPDDVIQNGKLEKIDSPGVNNDIYFEYNETGDLKKITDADGTVTDIIYDDLRVNTIKKDNVTVDFEYVNGKGLVNSVTTGLTTGNYFKNSTSYAYNNQFIKETIDPYNNKTTYDYDPVTGLLEELIQKASSGNNIITEYDYDIHGRLTQVSQSDSQNNYEYENGKLKKIHVNGYYYEFIYDSFNRLSQVKVNAQTLVSYDYYSKTYDGTTYYQDKLRNQHYGNNDYVTFIYDSEDRITQIKVNNEVR